MSHKFVAMIALAFTAAIPVGADAQYNRGFERDYRSGPQVVLCESHDRRVVRCGVDTRGGVRLVRRESKAACVQGRTWGHDRRGIWVSNGCRARFEVAGAYVPPGRSRGGDIVVCESIRERRNFCRIPGGARQVQLVRQLSKASCRQNGTWGFQRGGIWVDRGCRAEFRVY